MEDLLIKCANDEHLSFFEKGVFLTIAYGEYPDAEAAETKDALAVLLDTGYLDCSDGRFFVTGHQESSADLDKYWKVFYSEYPGRKLGVNKELSYFKAKYNKGKWRRILPTLPEKLQRQISEREAYQLAIDREKAKGNTRHNLFLPGWKNMKTYLNQEAWEEAFPLPEHYQKEEEMAPAPVATAGSPYERYLNWAKSEAESYNLTSVLGTLVLSETEFIDILSATHPDFTGYRTYMSMYSMGELIKKAQMEYFKTVPLRLLYPKFINYVKWHYQVAKSQ